MPNKSNVIQISGHASLTNIQSFNKRIAFIIKNDFALCGSIRNKCTLNEISEVYAVETDFGVQYGTNGTFNDTFLFECSDERGILISSSTDMLELDEKTDFVKKNIEDVVVEKGTFDAGELVSVDVQGNKIKAYIQSCGRINNILCYVVKLEQYGQHIVIENKISKIECQTQEKYVFPRYSLPSGDDRGIQGNLNSCYLDTSLFAIFTFNMFLDNMLFDTNGDANIEDLRNLLRTEIVYPLRRNGYVDCKTISVFRDKLQSLSPDGKFQFNERDPEEFFEQLFRLLTPNKYLLRTKLFRNFENEQKCFLTQIFYQSIQEKKRINLLDMLTLSFLEYEMFISKPPKCLILQLPRDGRDLKKFKKVYIPSKLDITSFIMDCAKTCKECSSKGLEFYFCQTCSLKTPEMTYYCKEHKLNCVHDKVKMPPVETQFNGPVELELAAVLCIARTHYVTFVKTNEITEKWIYFNSMEKINDGVFIPHIRETNLKAYFSEGFEQRNNSEYDEDVEKIESDAFVCIYKNPQLEMYSKDFNSD